MKTDLNLVQRIDSCCVLGCFVVYRDEGTKALADMEKLAEFSSFHAAVMALKVLRSSKDWLRAAELTLDDEDFMTVQVLARRLNKGRVVSRKSSTSTQLFSDSETGITFAEPFEGSLEDLI